MNEIMLEKLDEVYLRVHCDTGQALELKEFLSCYAPNFQYHPKFKARLWSGKISFFDVKYRKLPIGLLPNFVRFCKKFNYEFKFGFDVKCLYNNINVDIFLKQLKEIYETKMELRDYQYESFSKIVKNKRGVVLLPTGSGKSFVIYSLVQFLRAGEKKTILIVPNVSLVNQMYNDFKDYGWYDVDEYVGRLYSGEKPDFSKDVLITTWQSVYNKQQKFFENYDGVIIDECLHGDTKIKTKNGYKKIKDINVGDEVYSFNEKTNKNEIDIVVNKYENMFNSINEDMYEITLENGKSIKITGNHKVKTNRGWVEVKYLNECDELFDFVDFKNKILYEVKPSYHLGNCDDKFESARKWIRENGFNDFVIIDESYFNDDKKEIIKRSDIKKEIKEKILKVK